MSTGATHLGFFDLFECHAAIASEGARELRQMLLPAGRVRDGAARLRVLRDEGGLIAGRCLEVLHATFATPADRESILRLVQNLQRALNRLEETAARVDVYQLQVVMPEAERLADLLVSALATTERVLADLRRMRHVERLMADCNRIAGLAQEADGVVREAHARLFREATDPLLVIKWGDVLDHLRAAAARCGETAGAIERAVIATTA